MEDQMPPQMAEENPIEEYENDSTFINYRALYSEQHTMSWEDAVSYAEESAKHCFGNSSNAALRSYAPRKVMNGKVLMRNGASLRSTANAIFPDTMAYVCNFADSAGFAIICADDRVECPILACVDNGTLGDTVDNPGLSIFLENAQYFIEQSILKFEKEKDSLKIVAEEKLQKEIASKNSRLKKNLYKGSFTLWTSSEVKPLLPTTWGQSSEPYNNLTKECSNNDNNHAPAGCWATALAQMMAYYRYPNQIQCEDGSVLINWEEILKVKSASSGLLNDYYKYQVSCLLYYIGKNINMEYGCEGSGTTSSDALSYMKNIGYIIGGASDYDFDKIKLFLDNKKPVVMTGFENQRNRFLGTIYTYSGGHTWIVDGYSTTILQDYYYVTSSTEVLFCEAVSTKYDNTLLHINWGWNGTGDGYYAAGCFDTNNAFSYDSFIPKDRPNFRYKIMQYYVLK